MDTYRKHFLVHFQDEGSREAEDEDSWKHSLSISALAKLLKEDREAEAMLNLLRRGVPESDERTKKTPCRRNAPFRISPLKQLAPTVSVLSWGRPVHEPILTYTPRSVS